MVNTSKRKITITLKARFFKPGLFSAGFELQKGGKPFGTILWRGLLRRDTQVQTGGHRWVFRTEGSPPFSQNRIRIFRGKKEIGRFSSNRRFDYAAAGVLTLRNGGTYRWSRVNLRKSLWEFRGGRETTLSILYSYQFWKGKFVFTMRNIPEGERSLLMFMGILIIADFYSKYTPG